MDEKKHYEYLTKILDNIKGGLGLYRVDEDWKVSPVFLSSGIGELSNRNKDEYNNLFVGGNKLLETIHEEDRHLVIDAIKGAMLEGKVSSLSYRVDDKEGNYKWVNGLFSQFVDDEEMLLRVFFTPVTKQYDLQYKELIQRSEDLAIALNAAQQASKAKSTFLSRMSHEIRTPLNAIIGLTSLAVGDIGDYDAINSDLTKIGMSARYLLSLINDILDMSRIESGRVILNNEVILFEQFISSVNNIIYNQCSEKGIAYDAIVDGFVESAYVGDQIKLHQILVNILGNSVKFTPKGGKITLKIQQLRKEADNAVMRFTINDTGVGIDEKFLPHIFNSFEQEENDITTPYNGTGLGLAICKSMVEMMDGHIVVHSIKGVGSEFIVELRLKISEESMRHTMIKTEKQLPVLDTLVVDDDIIVCQSAQKTLERMGMYSEWVTSGYDAIEHVKQRKLSMKNYDLILLDWKMPGMDGIETAREIRKVVGPDVTIIIMTAYDWSQIEHTARVAGVNMFVQKPLFQSTLVSAFSKIYHAKDVEIKHDEKKYDLSGTNILLVEDHPLNVEVAKRLLEKEGIKVTVAENGLNAIEIFAQVLPGTFDAILMDIRMPIMDGLTAATHIRQMQKEGSRTIPIIAMTANAFEDDVRKSEESGMNAHLAKPIDPQILYATLDKLINPLR